MIIYKIRHKETGLYSAGGQTPRWTSKGKTWNSIAHLHSHLSQVFDCSYRCTRDYHNWEIVEIVVTETQSTSSTAQDYFEKLKAKKDAIKEKQEQDRKKQQFLKTQALSKLSDAEKAALGIR